MEQDVPHNCPNGHTWTTPMWYETGGWFYVNENECDCPVCGAEALDE